MQYATGLRRAGWITVIGIALAGRPLLADEDAARDDQTPKAREAAPDDEPAPDRDAAKTKDAAKARDAKPANNVAKREGRVVVPKYRLGAALAPVPAAVNDRLDLDGDGMLVERVAPGGPADKAGIKRDDVLLAIGDKPIKKYVDLVEASNASAGKMSVKLRRAEKTLTVTVTLEKHRKGDEKIFIPDNGAARPEKSDHPIKKKVR